MKKLITLFLSAFVVGCGDTTPDNWAIAPQLDFECTSVQAASCNSANANKKMFIGLTTNLTSDCVMALAGLSGDQLTTAFDFSVWTVTSDVSGSLTGVTTNWVNSEFMPMYQLPKKSFKLCAFIDINGNGAVDIGEPLAESTLEVGADNSSITVWTSY